MPNLKHHSLVGRNRIEDTGLIDGAGDRLLDEGMDAGFEKLTSDLEMPGGGHCDADRIHTAEKLPVIGLRTASTLGGHTRCCLRIQVRYCDERSLGQFGIFLGVKASDVACADHRTACRPKSVTPPG